MKKTLLATLIASSCILPSQVSAQQPIEKWRIFETTLKGPSSGNPFTDTQLTAEFINEQDTVVVSGFYDGDGLYKIRFMPQKEGRWNYAISSNSKQLKGKKKGHIVCTPAKPTNHGPVMVQDSVYFGYADGTPYYPFGTTCYAWVHQNDTLIDQTLETLSNGYFNKMRMCIFPKSYNWNLNEPEHYPFEGEALKDWDYTRFNPKYFQNIEHRVAQLDSLGIEADLIIFHPYDRWGFGSMDRETEDRYINYLIARFAPYKNVWWSMANEYDFMTNKPAEDWVHYLDMFAKNDPYGHLSSVHNGSVVYDFSDPNITHASIQNANTFEAKDYLKRYKKPVSYDECRYEGNIYLSWGNLTGKEMVNKFWQGVCSGGYVTHGETLSSDTDKLGEKSDEVLWWSKGGVLRGESPERIKFLRDIVKASPGHLAPTVIYEWWMPYPCVTYNEEYYLLYFNRDQPASIYLFLPETANYNVDVIDAWDMTITRLDSTYSGNSLVQLPGKELTALRIVKVEE